MSHGPFPPDPHEPHDPEAGRSGGEGQAPPPPPPSGAPQGQPYPPPGGGYYPPGGYQPGYPPGGYPPPYAPYGVHPVTGVPYSDKTKLIAGLLQILVPLGIGRFYLGDNKTGAWQLGVTLVTCGVGAIWPFIDGIIILATDNVTDGEGRPLRMT
jgi:TM2 domain-containing membrane protein YozV